MRDGFCVSLSLNLNLNINLNINLSLLFALDTSGGACSNTWCGRGDCCIGRYSRNGSHSSNGS